MSIRSITGRFSVALRVVSTSRFSPGSRAQSRIIGVLVLTIIAIILATTLGVFSLAIAPSENNDVSISGVDIEINTGNGHVTVSHTGGDSLSPDGIRVDVVQDRTQTSVQLTDFTNRPADDSQFSAGQRWVHAFAIDADNDIRATVVHEPSETVLSSADVDAQN